MTLFRRLRLILNGTGILTDRGDWIEADRVLGCAYPRRESALAGLRQQGIAVLVNLHERSHAPERLAQHGLTEVHLPVRDFTAPTPEQLGRGVEAIEQALANGHRVAVHCGGGIGRTGTLLACYLVRQGMGAAEAIARVRAMRPGSVETRAQVAAVEAYAANAKSLRDQAAPEAP
jgi:atypical dual specificity phosphatase